MRLKDVLRGMRACARGLRAAVHSSSAVGVGRVIIQQEHVTKGSGVLQLCRHFGFDPAQCIVFGDWYNDLAMFSVGCTNVAMANAVPEVKARADYVTERGCEQDGVAEFLEKAFL